MRRLATASPAATMVVALLAGLVFVLFRLSSYDWNPTGFVHAGDRFVHAEDAPADLLIRRNAVGFDGTGFYRIALDPVTREVYANGIVLDLPAFRHQRILYPLIVWAAAGGGRATAVGWGLIAVNLAAFAAVGWIGGALAVRLGRRPWWGLALAAYPGFAISLGLDTAEIVASAIALGGLLLIERRSYGWATLSFTAAMLARETTLLIVIGIAVASLVARRNEDRKIPVPVFAAPLIAYIAWQLALWWWWGTLPLRQGSGVDITLPLVGLLQRIPDWTSDSSTQAAFHYVLLAAIVLLVVEVLRRTSTSQAPIHIRIAAVLSLALAALLSDDIWLHHWGFLRALSEPYLLGTVVLLASERTRLDRLLLGSAGLWTAIAVNLAVHP